MSADTRGAVVLGLNFRMTVYPPSTQWWTARAFSLFSAFVLRMLKEKGERIWLAEKERRQTGSA